MHIKPLQDWAVIRKSEAPEMTASGIIIPEVAKEKPLEGTILAIGPGKLVPEKGKEKEKEKKKKFVPTVLKPGQHVLYQKYAEREVELGGQTITLVREEDILGVMEERSLVERKMHAVEMKKDGPVAIRPEAKVPAVTAPPAAGKKEQPAPKTRPAVKKTSPKAPAAKKAAGPEKAKAPSKKMTTKAASATKSAPKKAARPAAKSPKKSPAATKAKAKKK
ncbi:MAG: co-chaperone GroES [Nitrospiraceae bacterium]|nr:co-chaperone GroES [Nitrospiraceae bacterium]